MVATRKIRATDRPRKQHIADDGHAVFGAKEHHVAGRATRAVKHLQRAAGDFRGIAVFEPAVGHERPGGRKTEALALHGRLVDPGRLVLLRPLDRHAELRAQGVGDGVVADMAMCEQDFFGVCAVLLCDGQDTVNIAAGIGDGGSTIVANQQRAVLFKRRNGDDNDFRVILCVHLRMAGITRLYRAEPAPALGLWGALLHPRENITKSVGDDSMMRSF